MGRRPDVETASKARTASAVGGLGVRLAVALAELPLKRPWRGPDTTVHNVGYEVTRRVMRTFMDYVVSLSTPELRSVEVVLDDLCRSVLPPLVHRLGVSVEDDVVGGVPGTWYRSGSDEPTGTILYLHGGGYVATSPSMYALFTGWLARHTDCDVFVADYRLAPEFPYPAAMEDALAVYRALLDSGEDPARIVFAGDSGGGGLAATLVLDVAQCGLPAPRGVLLFSPEVDLVLDEPSVTENADLDILPRHIPVQPYLGDLDAHTAIVSTVYADLSGFPNTLVAWGGEEIFRDAIERFVQRLRDAAVPTLAREEPHMFHVYMILMPWAPASQRLYRRVDRTFAQWRASQRAG